MIKIDIKGSLLAILLFSFIPVFAKDFVLLNEQILNDKVVEKINKIGNELYNKSGIFVAVVAGDNTSYEKLLNEKYKLREPFVLLLFSKISHKVDIIASKDTLAFFDKQAILSPYPNEGTILPILSSKKAKDKYNAAILNGYADICDQIANYFNIKLENSIGNTNKDVLNILRIVIYGFLCISVIYYFNRRIKRRKR